MVARDGQDLQTQTSQDTTGHDATHQKFLSDSGLFGGTEQNALKTTDKTQGATTGDQVTVQPNQLIQAAQAAGKEIASYISSGANQNDRIQLQGPDGKMIETTVGARINDLKGLINTDSQNAIVAADALSTQSGGTLSTRLQDNLNSLDQAVQPFGMSVRDPNFMQELQTAAQQATTPDQMQAFQNIQNLMNQRSMLESERFLPASARLSYALLKADGFTEDPMASMESIRSTGMPKASQAELTDAYTMMQVAGRTDPEVANSPMYQQVSMTINGQYAQTQSERGAKIVKELADAQAASHNGDPKAADTLYQAALKDANGVDQKWLAAQLRIPANSQNPQVANALVGILTDVKEAKTQYASFLNGQSRYSDALPLLLQVQADTPELAQKDPTFNQNLNKAMFGNAMSTSDLQVHQQKFAQDMQDHKWNEAQQELDVLKKGYQDTMQNLKADNKVTDDQKTELNKQLADLDKNKGTMDPTEYQIEQQRLQNEIKVMNAAAQNTQDLDKQDHYLTYLQGVLAYSKDDKDTAHACFESIKDDKDIADNKQLNLDQLLDATKHQNWFQRNWHAIATVGAVVAGVAVGVAAGALTFGAGAAPAGIAATAGFLALAGAGGAVAGGLTYSGIKGATLGFDKVGWGDFKDGAITGGLSAITTAAGPLLGGAKVAAAGAEVAGGTEAAAAGSSGLLSSTIGRLGLGVSTRGALVGGGVAVGKEGYQVAFQGKSLEDAGKSLLWEAPLYAVGGSMAYSKGITLGTLGLNPRSLAVGAGLAGTKEGAEMAFDGKSFKDAAGSFVLEAPMFGATVGMAGNAAAKVMTPEGLTAASFKPALLASSKVAVGLGGLAPALEVGHDAYESYSPIALPVLGRPDHIPLDPNKPDQNEQIWMNYGQVNPNLFGAPDATVTQPQATDTGGGGTAQPAAKPYQRMSYDAVQKASQDQITDEPVK